MKTAKVKCFWRPFSKRAEQYRRRAAWATSGAHCACIEHHGCHQPALCQPPNGVLPLTVHCSVQQPEKAGATGLLQGRRGLHGPTAMAQPPLQQSSSPSGCAPRQPFEKNSSQLSAAVQMAFLAPRRSSTVRGFCCPYSLPYPQNSADSMSSCSPPDSTGNCAAHRLP